MHFFVNNQAVLTNFDSFNKLHMKISVKTFNLITLNICVFSTAKGNLLFYESFASDKWR